MEENNVNNRVRPQNKHLKMFEKGKSGNPKGRPIGSRGYKEIYKEALIKLAKLNKKEPDELEVEMLSKAIMQARSGDYKFYKDVMDRLYGSAVTKTEHSGADGENLTIKTIIINKDASND